MYFYFSQKNNIVKNNLNSKCNFLLLMIHPTDKKNKIKSVNLTKKIYIYILVNIPQ